VSRCTCPFGFRSLGGGRRVEARYSTDPRCPDHGNRAHLALARMSNGDTVDDLQEIEVAGDDRDVAG